MTKQKKSFQVIILSLFLANIFFSFSAGIAYAQNQPREYKGADAQLTQFLCTPTDARTNPEAAKGDLYNCINKIYRFALVLCSVFGVFMIVIAGYIYMAASGNEESVTKAKEILETTVASLVILVGGYIFLRYLNPDLIKFQPIQPPSITGRDLWADVTKEQLAGLFEGGTDSTPGATIPTGNAAQLATQILNNSTKITLATAHASGNNDQATAKQNIINTSQNKPAQRSSYKDGNNTGPGGTVAVSEQVLRTLVALGNSYSFRVSEVAGGVHGSNSDHYTGRALDIDQINGRAVNKSNPDYKAVMQICKAQGATIALGPGDKGHDTHVHCGWGK